MPFKKLSFKGAFGDALSARLDLPDQGTPSAVSLFAHCFTCNKNLKAVANISKALTGCGFAVFRFDFTGLGESAGDFADTNFSSNILDLIAASEFLNSEYTAPSILIGHSLGGAAVIHAASQIPSVAAVAAIAAPSNPRLLMRHLEEKKQQIEVEGEAEVMLAGRQFKIKKQFLEDLKQANMDAAIRKLDRALLILHSPLDEVVGVENAARIFQAALHPKSFVSLDRADHLLSKQKDSIYAGTMIATWAQRYISS
jgi:putative redox protein